MVLLRSSSLPAVLAPVSQCINKPRMVVEGLLWQVQNLGQRSWFRSMIAVEEVRIASFFAFAVCGLEQKPRACAGDTIERVSSARMV